LTAAAQWVPAEDDEPPRTLPRAEPAMGGGATETIVEVPARMAGAGLQLTTTRGGTREAGALGHYKMRSLPAQGL